MGWEQKQGGKSRVWTALGPWLKVEDAEEGIKMMQEGEVKQLSGVLTRRKQSDLDGWSMVDMTSTEQGSNR